MKKILFVGMGLAALLVFFPGATAEAQEISQADRVVLSQGLQVLDRTLDVIEAKIPTMTADEKVRASGQLVVIASTLRTMDSVLAMASRPAQNVAQPAAPAPVAVAPSAGGVPLSVAVAPQAPEAPLAPEAPVAPAAPSVLAEIPERMVGNQAAQVGGFRGTVRQWIGPLVFILFAAAVLLFLLRQPRAQLAAESVSPDAPLAASVPVAASVKSQAPSVPSAPTPSVAASAKTEPTAPPRLNV